MRATELPNEDGQDIDMKNVTNIVGWLDEGARRARGERLLEELCSRLAAAGIPLDRAAIFVTMLHPDIAGRSYVWSRGRPGESREIGYHLLQSEPLLSNPFVWFQGSNGSQTKL
jgi:adenylate cyclase